jgi:TolA-binding protein
MDREEPMGHNLDALSAIVRRDLDLRQRDASVVADVRRRLARGEEPSRAKRSSPRRWLIAGFLPIAAAVAALLLFVLRTPKPLEAVSRDAQGHEQQVAEGFFIDTADAPRAVHFTDGTQVQWKAGTRGRVTDIRPNGARLVLEAGALVARVKHTGEARWAVLAGPYEVQVTGTTFDVQWEPKDGQFGIRLTEGSVVVRGCGLASEGRKVRGGEHLALSCASSGGTPMSTPVANTASVAPGPAPAATPAPAPSASPVTAAPAISGQKAPAPLGGLLDADAMLDVARARRLEGDVNGAAAHFAELRRKFPGTAQSAMAAFELGRIAMDVQARPGVAAEYFETYWREAPHGALRQEALGRAMAARHRAGNDAIARTHAATYLAESPRGPHAAGAHKIMTGGDE